MKIQFVNDEGKVIELAPGMYILLCHPKRQDAPYMFVLVAPNGSLLASGECHPYKWKGAMYPIDLGLVYKAFEHLAEGILALSGVRWRSDFWNWQKEMAAQPKMEVLQGYMVVE